MAIDTAIGLARSGWRVIFFAACGPPDPELHKAGVECVLTHQLDIASDPKRARATVNGIWNPQARKLLANLLAKLDPAQTVLHCHGYAKALSPSIGPLLSAPGWASVFTCHEYFLACPNGGFCDYRKQEICTRRPLGADCLSTNCDRRHWAHKLWRSARQGVAFA